MLGPERPEPEPREPELPERGLRERELAGRDCEPELPDPTLSVLEPRVVGWWLAVLVDELVDEQPDVVATMMPNMTHARTR